MSLGFKLIDRLVSLENLELDANNYRLSFENDGKKFTDHEAATNEIQAGTQKKLVKEKLADLKESILENGFLEVDRIVVRKSDVSDNFIVIEGNRRTAAFKALITDHENSIVNLSSDLRNKAEAINVIEITGSKEDIERYAATLMGIRHVSGPKKWPGIQSARLIYDLRVKGKKVKQIGALLGISAMDANRRLRGFLAYNQMREDKTFKPLVKTNHYTLLLEFLPMRNSIGKDWLGWNESHLKFTNDLNRKRLYVALTKPLSNRKPEISNPDDARLFLKALSISSLKAKLEDGFTLHELGPIVDKHSSIKIITDFDRFLSRLDSSVSEEVKSALLKVKSSVEKVLE
jgi:hypothetical protein